MIESDDFTILLVEDNLNDIFLVKRAFRKADTPHMLQVVTDGEEAIHYLQGEGRYANRRVYPLPQLIVMDVNMPRKNGFEVLEWIKSESVLRRIPVIIVSASDVHSDINRAYELGANAYMVKPVDFKMVENLFQSITHYWGAECAKPELRIEQHA